MRWARTALAVGAALALGGALGAWLFAERATMCVDGVDGEGGPAGFCVDLAELSVAGGLGTAVVLGLVVAVVIALRARR